MNILPLLITMGLCLVFSLVVFIWREHRPQPVRAPVRPDHPFNPSA
jgi:hypothetical protein